MDAAPLLVESAGSEAASIPALACPFAERPAEAARPPVGSTARLRP
jgi:hypothetical protein